MAAGGDSGSGPRPSDKAARPPMTAIDSTIQSIKEVVGEHSDADILDALRDSNMDPNETAQKLLNQDPFHEVKRKKDKKRESAGQKSFAQTSAQGEHGSQGTRPHTQRVEIDQRRAHNQGQTYGLKKVSIALVDFTIPEPPEFLPIEEPHCDALNFRSVGQEIDWFARRGGHRAPSPRLLDKLQDEVGSRGIWEELSRLSATAASA
ncbi:uncharacterized protein LOC124706789 [Lolium rigidum]|uniref:uncharacterized protein LOC124706789 n=1 Tax=Lolium rigidum TaxID=89674 RepID=UPI001F5D58E1|nr:uncharacterized protein LOC124706789 [Lolium rigidum]